MTKPSYIALLNPDIYFDKSFKWDLLLTILSNSNIGIIGPMINEKGILNKPKTYPNIFNKKKEINENYFVDVDWVSGSCMFLKHSTFKKINGFDTRFFMYMEDVDICFRCQKLGLLNFYLPYLKIYHNAKKRSKNNLKYFFIHLISFIKYHRKMIFIK